MSRKSHKIRWHIKNKPHFSEIEDERNPHYSIVSAERDPKMTFRQEEQEQRPNAYRRVDIYEIEWLQRITYKD